MRSCYPLLLEFSLQMDRSIDTRIIKSFQSSPSVRDSLPKIPPVSIVDSRFIPFQTRLYNCTSRTHFRSDLLYLRGEYSQFRDLAIFQRFCAVRSSLKIPLSNIAKPKRGPWCRARGGVHHHPSPGPTPRPSFGLYIRKPSEYNHF